MNPINPLNVDIVNYDHVHYHHALRDLYSLSPMRCLRREYASSLIRYLTETFLLRVGWRTFLESSSFIPPRKILTPSEFRRTPTSLTKCSSLIILLLTSLKITLKTTIGLNISAKSRAREYLLSLGS
ncbi:126aa long hypothetical protein [Pyrococcus horikoshii OT3]|uniref:Uncharacterized protein n=1 Tax=Pyrococcus horikoshii (strain ATCC 700860 / DSM 12428 / JCM 9974 / NBRC 100139 / OT-3) TaxID=70601 RepID=O57913_PYRHO|nr:126aa long hypothetical protein [Pyrococcus horikoshii OT3]